jgi:hypothetical protein
VLPTSPVAGHKILQVTIGLQRLDEQVLAGVHVHPGNDPRGPVLVPHPHVVHGQMKQWERNVGHELPPDGIAQVGRLLRHHAVAKQWEHVVVLTLELKLQLRVIFLKFVRVRHAPSPDHEKRALLDQRARMCKV